MKKNVVFLLFAISTMAIVDICAGSRSIARSGRALSARWTPQAQPSLFQSTIPMQFSSSSNSGSSKKPYNPRFIAAGIVAFIALDKLNLSHSEIAPEQDNEITAACSSLENLNISDFQDIASEIVSGLSALPENSNHVLKNLNLSDTEVTPKKVAAIINACPKLKALNISGCQGAAAGIEAIVKKLHRRNVKFYKKFLALESLTMANTGATERQITTIMQGCPYLVELNLSSCPGAVLALLNLSSGDLRSLKELRLYNININPEEIAAIQNKLPSQCRIFHS